MENIMLQDEKKEWIKIIDFGLSNKFSEENPLKTLCGSPEYAAPELFVKGKTYGPEVDLWSLGVILYVMGTGRLPFTSPRDKSTSSDERRQRLMVQINRGLSAPHERLIVTLSAEYKNLLRLALMPAAHKRIRLDELCRHPWIDASTSSTTTTTTTTDKLKLCLPEREAIVREISALVNMDCREVGMNIGSRRFGNLGGIYNIMSYQLQLQKLQRSTEVKSFRTSQNLKHNFEKSSPESPKKIKINSTLSTLKHGFSSKQTIKQTQFSCVQNKICKKDVRRIAADSKHDLEKAKKKCVTPIQPTPKKITRSIFTQVQNNKIHETKDYVMQTSNKRFDKAETL